MIGGLSLAGAAVVLACLLAETGRACWRRLRHRFVRCQWPRFRQMLTEAAPRTDREREP